MEKTVHFRSRPNNLCWTSRNLVDCRGRELTENISATNCPNEKDIYGLLSLIGISESRWRINWKNCVRLANNPVIGLVRPTRPNQLLAGLKLRSQKLFLPDDEPTTFKTSNRLVLNDAINGYQSISLYNSGKGSNPVTVSQI